MGISSAAQEALFLRNILADLGFPQASPTTIYEDSQGCIALTKDPVQPRRTKHIDVRHHYVREATARGDIRPIYLPTERMLADALTKPVSAPKLKTFTNNIMTIETTP